MMGLTLLLSLGGVGCDRKVEPFKPGEQPSPPDLARIFSEPEEPDTRDRRVAGSPAAARMPGASRSAFPPSRTATAGPSTAADTISGRIEVATELAQDLPKSAILFIIARLHGTTGGPPLAVLRIESPQFPLDYSMGPENVMIPSVQFAGDISLSARLDSDGNATTRDAGDLSASVTDALQPGATGVVLVLDSQL